MIIPPTMGVAILRMTSEPVPPNRSVIADIHHLIDGHLRACKRFSLKEIQLANGTRCVFSH